MSIYNTNRERTAWSRTWTLQQTSRFSKIWWKKKNCVTTWTMQQGDATKGAFDQVCKWTPLKMTRVYWQHRHGNTSLSAHNKLRGSTKNDSYYDFVCFEGRLFSVVFCLMIWWRLETNLNLSWSPDCSFSHTESQHDKNYPKINKQMASMRGQTTLRIISHLTFLHKMMFKKELQPHTLSNVHIFT